MCPAKLTILSSIAYNTILKIIPFIFLVLKPIYLQWIVDIPGANDMPFKIVSYYQLKTKEYMFSSSQLMSNLTLTENLLNQAVKN